MGTLNVKDGTHVAQVSFVNLQHRPHRYLSASSVALTGIKVHCGKNETGGTSLKWHLLSFFDNDM